MCVHIAQTKLMQILRSSTDIKTPIIINYDNIFVTIKWHAFGCYHVNAVVVLICSFLEFFLV